MAALTNQVNRLPGLPVYRFDGRTSNRLQNLLPDRWQWNIPVLKRFMNCEAELTQSLIETIERIPPVALALNPVKDTTSILALLHTALDRVLAGSQNPALAVGGGIDGWLLVLLLRERGIELPIYTIVSNLPDYCEWEVTQAIAAELAIPVNPVIVNEAAFVAGLDRLVSIAEVPLYNLHPVSRVLLLDTLKASGVDTLITGDGADEAFATRDGDDLLPIYAALHDRFNIRWGSPFVDPEIVASLDPQMRQPDKPVLRAIAKGRIPDFQLSAPKKPTYTPAMDLSPVADLIFQKRFLEHAALSWTPKSIKEQTLLTSLGLLQRCFEQVQPCLLPES